MALVNTPYGSIEMDEEQKRRFEAAGLNLTDQQRKQIENAELDLQIAQAESAVGKDEFNRLVNENRAKMQATQAAANRKPVYATERAREAARVAQTNAIADERSRFREGVEAEKFLNRRDTLRKNRELWEQKQREAGTPENIQAYPSVFDRPAAPEPDRSIPFWDRPGYQPIMSTGSSGYSREGRDIMAENYRARKDARRMYGSGKAGPAPMGRGEAEGIAASNRAALAEIAAIREQAAQQYRDFMDQIKNLNPAVPTTVPPAVPAAVPPTAPPVKKSIEPATTPPESIASIEPPFRIQREDLIKPFSLEETKVMAPKNEPPVTPTPTSAAPPTPATPATPTLTPTPPYAPPVDQEEKKKRAARAAKIKKELGLQ